MTFSAFLVVIDIHRVCCSEFAVASVPRRFRLRGVYMGVGGEKGETSGRASIESEFGSRRTHRKP